jgi:hypothetical protein
MPWLDTFGITAMAPADNDTTPAATVVAASKQRRTAPAVALRRWESTIGEYSVINCFLVMCD